MLTVACVLKVGRWRHGAYGPEHVLLLRRQVQEHLSLPHRFVCLSDVQVSGIECVKLKNHWPGWWSKMELFRHDFGRAMYLDLDTSIVGSIDDMADHQHTFTALEAMSENQRPCLGSGVLAWEGRRLDLYDTFASDAVGHMERCSVRKNWGDQGFIYHHVGHWDAWQSLFPGAIVSYKYHCKGKKQLPAGVKIVCFHGRPKPWDREVKEKWVPR